MFDKIILGGCHLPPQVVKPRRITVCVERSPQGLQLLPSPNQAHSLKRLGVSIGEVSGGRKRGDGRGEGEGDRGDREEQSPLLLSTCGVVLSRTAPHLNMVTLIQFVLLLKPQPLTDAAQCSGLEWSWDVHLAAF